MIHDWYDTAETGRYRHTVTRPVHYHIPELHRDYDIHGITGQLLAIIRGGLLTIQPGYAFDGATGAPDIRLLMRAVVVHDILCQLCYCPGWPMTRLAADRVFYRVARKDAPLLAAVYYTGIRVGGYIHRRLNPPSPAEGTKFLPA